MLPCSPSQETGTLSNSWETAVHSLVVYIWTILFAEQSLFYIQRDPAALQHQHVCLTHIKDVIQSAAALISGPLWNKKPLNTTGQANNNADKLTSWRSSLENSRLMPESCIIVLLLYCFHSAWLRFNSSFTQLLLCFSILHLHHKHYNNGSEADSHSPSGDWSHQPVCVVMIWYHEPL